MCRAAETVNFVTEFFSHIFHSAAFNTRRRDNFFSYGAPKFNWKFFSLIISLSDVFSLHGNAFRSSSTDKEVTAVNKPSNMYNVFNPCTFIHCYLIRLEIFSYSILIEHHFVSLYISSYRVSTNTCIFGFL